MANYADAYAVCPFYIRTTNNRIHCEGLQKRNTINLVFEDIKKQYEYLRIYCCSLANYGRCPICEILNRKYGDTNEGIQD